MDYQELNDFQEKPQQLNNCCERVIKIIQECQQRIFLSQTFIIEEVPLEYFLMIIREIRKNQHDVTEVRKNIQNCINIFHVYQNILEEKTHDIRVNKIEKEVILEKLGELSGRNVKIRIFAKKISDKLIKGVKNDWDKLVEILIKKIENKSQLWESEHSAIFNEKKLIDDYIRQFNQDLSNEVNIWKHKKIQEQSYILNDYIQTQISECQLNHNFYRYIHEPNWFFYGHEPNWFFDGSDANLAFINFPFPELGLIDIINYNIKNTYINKAVQAGRQQFFERKDAIFEEIKEMTNSFVEEKIAKADEIIQEAISLYDNLLEQQQIAEKLEDDIAWIYQKCQELEHVQKTIESSIKIPRH